MIGQGANSSGAPVEQNAQGLFPSRTEPRKKLLKTERLRPGRFPIEARSLWEGATRRFHKSASGLFPEPGMRFGGLLFQQRSDHHKPTLPTRKGFPARQRERGGFGVIASQLKQRHFGQRVHHAPDPRPITAPEHMRQGSARV